LISSLRLLVGIFSAFFGVLFLVVVAVILFTGRLELRPTSLTIESAEDEGFPDAEFIRVIGGHIVFSEAEIDLSFNEDELLYVTAPVVSDSLRKEWQATGADGERLDASRLRLMVTFDGERFRKLWPEEASRILGGEPHELTTVQMDVQGESELSKFMTFKPSDFDSRTDGFDWEQARAVTHGRHFNGPGTIVKYVVYAAGLFVFALVVIMYGAPAPPKQVGDQYKFTLKSIWYGTGEPVEKEKDSGVPSIPNEPILTSSTASALEDSPEAAETSAQPEGASCALEVVSGVLGQIAVHISEIPSEWLRKDALFMIETEAHVIDPVDPIHARKVIFTKDIALYDEVEPINVSLRDLEVFGYEGKTLEIRLYASLLVDGTRVQEQRIDSDSVCFAGLSPSFEPPEDLPFNLEDTYSWFDNFKVVNFPSKVGFIISSVFLWGAIPVGLWTAIPKALASFSVENQALFFDLLFAGLTLTIATAIVMAVMFAAYMVLESSLSSYGRIALKPISDTARAKREVPLSELFEGSSKIDLDDVTLRIIGRNDEYIQVGRAERGVMTVKEKYESVREKVLYETHIPHIAKGEAIESLLDDIIPFDTLFSSHYPPLEVTDVHRIGFALQVVLVHPKFVDVRSMILLDRNEEEDTGNFLFEDFIKPA
jgi:hypothetical protein